MPETGSASLLAAVERARTTASWLLGTLGAVAGALLIGGSIGDLSKIDGDCETIRAIAGVVLATAGVASSIFAVARVLAPVQPLKDRKPVSGLADEHVATIVAADPTLLSGLATSLDEFRTRYGQALTDFRTAQENAVSSPSEATRSALAASQESLKAYQPVAQYLRDLAIHEHARRRFNSAVKTIAFSTPAVIAGAILFNSALAG